MTLADAPVVCRALGLEDGMVWLYTPPNPFPPPSSNIDWQQATRAVAQLQNFRNDLPLVANFAAEVGGDRARDGNENVRQDWGLP